jgi:hypothetical protein
MSRVLCPLESLISDLLIRLLFSLAPSGYALVHMTSSHKTTVLCLSIFPYSKVQPLDLLTPEMAFLTLASPGYALVHMTTSHKTAALSLFGVLGF